MSKFNEKGMCTIAPRSGAIGELQHTDKGWNGTFFGKIVVE